MTKRTKCCIVDSVFGHTLEDGVVFVGITSAVIATVTFLSSIIGLAFMVSEDDDQFGRSPRMAANLIVMLVFFPMSFYQFILSLLLLWQAIKMKGNVFLCSLWFSSHMAILFVYTILIIIKVVACFCTHHYIMGIVTIVSGILYEVLFIYFSIIVNSYNYSLDAERFY